MKALLLAGGHGTRLRPITHTQSKQLIPVANRPILFYGLDAIAGAGIEEVGIIVGDTEREIVEAVGDGSAWDVRVTYIRQDAPKGLAHAVLTAADFLGDGDFLMYLGDNLVKDDLRDFVGAFETDRPDAQLFLVEVPDPQRFGVAVVEGDVVVDLQEKPAEPASSLALSGIYLFTPRIIEAAGAIAPSARGELEITDAIQHIVANGGVVRAKRIERWWKDSGRLEDLLDANRFILDDQQGAVDGQVDEASQVIGEVRIGEGTVVAESVLRGPAIIGEGCRIERSVVDPYTSINSNTVIVNSHIGNSIVMSDCRIEGALAIRDSLLGRNVGIHRDPSRGSALRLMIGDNSAVTL